MQCESCNGTGKKPARLPWHEINGGFLPGGGQPMTIAEAETAEHAKIDAGHQGFPERWNLVKLGEDGWVRNWGDAAVCSPYFEVLRREAKTASSGITAVEFLVLCPTFLGSHLRFYMSGQGWGSY